MGKPIISITMGDPAGIGAEIIVKALSNREIYKRSKPVVIGSKIVMKDALSFINPKGRIPRACPWMNE